MAKKRVEILTTSILVQPALFLLRFCSCDPKQGRFILGDVLYWIFVISNFVWTIFIVMKLVNEKTLDVAANTSHFRKYSVLESWKATFGACPDFGPPSSDLFFYSTLRNQSLMDATRTMAKAIQLKFYRTRLTQLTEAFYENFWRSDKIPEHAEKYDRQHRTILRSIKIYRNILCSCIVFIFLSPLLLPTRTLPLEMWFFGLEERMHETPWFEVLYFLQTFSSALPYVFCLIPFDMLFVAMVGSSNIQFDMLATKLKEMGDNFGTKGDEEMFEELKEAIQHHDKILEFLSDVERYFTRILLKQYVDAVTCMGVYLYLQRQNFHFVYMFSLMTNMSQTLFYSLCGQTIQDQSAGVADAAFQSCWEKSGDGKVRQGLIFIIQRAQRNVRITAGGVLDLSFETFLGMLKAAFSFLAVLRSTNRN